MVLKQILVSDRFEFTERSVNLSWGHHREVASVKKIGIDEKGKLFLSDDPDIDAIIKIPI